MSLRARLRRRLPTRRPRLTEAGGARAGSPPGDRARVNAVEFVCNICGCDALADRDDFERERPSCPGCRSTVRVRAVIHVLSTALFGESLKIDDFPYRPDLNGLGLSDSPGYAKRLVTKLPGYRNTSYHGTSRLDITDAPAELDGTLDFLISSEVFEHVAPPVQRAFDNAFRLLRPGGVLVLTVPYVREDETLEHFPHLNRHEVAEFEGQPILINRTREGGWEIFDDLIFHGGEGATLEMRRFARESVLRHMAEAGFTDVIECSASCAEFGVLWDVDWSLPMLGRRGSDGGSSSSPIPQVAAVSLASS